MSVDSYKLVNQNAMCVCVFPPRVPCFGCAYRGTQENHIDLFIRGVPLNKDTPKCKCLDGLGVPSRSAEKSANKVPAGFPKQKMSLLPFKATSGVSSRQTNATGNILGEKHIKIKQMELEGAQLGEKASEALSP